jgi:CRISPR-associated protein Csb2
MLAIKVEYITRVCMATRHNDPSRSTPEWPPHPDRLYSALVAAAAQAQYDQGHQSSSFIPEESKCALQWLAQQGPPDIAASDARLRSAPKVYMPTNPHTDEVWQKPKAGKPPVPKEWFDLKTLLPVHRKKAELAVPAVTPDDPAVYFVWHQADPREPLDLLPDGPLSVLQNICGNVTYLGRSRSLVRACIVDDPPRAAFVPDPVGQIQLRVPGADRIEYLIGKYDRDGGKPEPSPPRRYRRTDSIQRRIEPAHTIFDRMYIFKPKEGAPCLPIEATLKITRLFRKAVIRCIYDEIYASADRGEGSPDLQDLLDCNRKIPPILSGHDLDSTVTEQPHVAFAALPFVDRFVRNADGEIKGLAVLIPANPSDQALQMLAAALLRLQKNGLGIPGIGTWQLAEVPADDPPIKALDTTTWSGPARVWATVTPMVFGHFPKKTNGGELHIILDSLRMIDIDPDLVAEITVERHSPLHGVPPSWQFKTRLSRKPKKKEPPHIFRHVTIQFKRDVQGPIVLGCMRFFGLGLMRPLERTSWQN